MVLFPNLNDLLLGSAFCFQLIDCASSHVFPTTVDAAPQSSNTGYGSLGSFWLTVLPTIPSDCFVAVTHTSSVRSKPDSHVFSFTGPFRVFIMF